MTIAFPLQWPHWVKRTAASQRRNAKFNRKEQRKSDYSGNMLTISLQLSISDARKRLQRELDLLNARNAVLSTSAELRLDGQPRSDRRPPDDPGAAAYFTLGGKQMCMPCDKWDRLADNIAAIAGHIDAIRRIERYGVQSVEEAFAGFVALPAPDWKRTLGLTDGPVTIEDVDAAYRRLAKNAHSDAGGSHEQMISLNAARDQAKRELGA